jgi:hypothetical protein
MRYFWVGILALVLASDLQAQPSADTCKNWFQPNTVGPHNQPPVIFGDRHLVPAMRIRIVLSDGRSAVPARTVTVNYGWRWLEYPYPEHSWGAWSDASDRAECELDQDGWIQVPSHEVQTRGWYDGRYTRFPWPRRPHFTGIEIVAVTKGGFARIYVQPRDLKRFADSDLIVQVFDGWRTRLAWKPKESRQERP